MISYYFNALLIAMAGYVSPVQHDSKPLKETTFAAKPAKTESFKITAGSEGKIRLINKKTGKPYVSAGDSIEIGQILFDLELNDNHSQQIVAERSGRNLTINVTNGQKVKEGAEVMSMDVPVMTAEELFQERANFAGMEYLAPKGFKPVDIRENPDMYYQWAIKHKSKKLEVRYFIYNLKQDLRSFEETKKGDGKSTMLDPNKFYHSFSLMNVLNTAAGDAKEMEELPEEIVSNLFHADWGGASAYTPRKTFAPGYKKCMMLAIHKKDKADAYIILLMDSEKDVEAELAEVMFNLHFTE